MNRMKTIGVLLLVVALMVTFAFSAIAQDKTAKEKAKKATKSTSVEKAKDAKHDCASCPSAVKAKCPSAKKDNVFIKNAKKAAGVKATSDCQKECATKCDKTADKTKCEKECATKCNKEKK